MMYPFMTLNDDTEITHSEMMPGGYVKVYFERPTWMGFDVATCYLPNNYWTGIKGFSTKDLNLFKQIINNCKDIIMDCSQKGGIVSPPFV